MGASVQARGIEAIAVRRTTVVDADKVRYRVYSSPSEFVAVIAESALMAIKVAGVNEPYRIVRDLPTQEIALEAQKIAKETTEQKVHFATTPKPQKNHFKTEMTAAISSAAEAKERFVPMHLRDLNTKKSFEGFIVPHEILNQLIEAVRKPAPPPKPETPPPAAPAAPVAAVPSSPTPPVTEATPKVEAAVAVETEAAVSPPKGDGEVLSAEEVEKLLNDGA